MEGGQRDLFPLKEKCGIFWNFLKKCPDFLSKMSGIQDTRTPLFCNSDPWPAGGEDGSRLESVSQEEHEAIPIQVPMFIFDSHTLKQPDSVRVI